MTPLLVAIQLALADPRQAAIRDAFSQHKEAVDACGYTSGDIELSWQIVQSAPLDVELTRNTTDPTQGACVLRAVEAMRFDTDDGPATYSVRYRVPPPRCLLHPIPDDAPRATVGRVTIVELGKRGGDLPALGRAYRTETAKLLEHLGLPEPSEDLEVYLYDSTEQKKAFTGKKAVGHVCGNGIHTTWTTVDTHELSHVLLRPLGRPPPLFSEGSAVWLHWGDALITPAATTGWQALGLTAEDLRMVTSFASVARDQGHAQEAYMLAGLLVRELVATVGVERFLQLYREAAALGESGDINEVLAPSGLSVDALFERARGRVVIGKPLLE